MPPDPIPGPYQNPKFRHTNWRSCRTSVPVPFYCFCLRGWHEAGFTFWTRVLAPDIYRAQWSKVCTKLLNDVIHNVSNMFIENFEVWFFKEFSLKGPAKPNQWRIAITGLLQWFTFIGKILTTSLLKIVGGHASMICATFTHNDI
jgi:hypothetical protein